MLSRLHIKDFAIIEDIEISFARGFNVITGETGAGKTIVVEALGSALGGRTATDLVRSGCESAQVTAQFDAGRISEITKKMLSTAGIDVEDEIIVHRVIGAQGRGKISVNGVPVTTSMLREISSHLVDISSQHEHQLLLDESKHALILDSFAGLDETRQKYLSAHADFISCSEKLRKLEELGKSAGERLDYLKFQHDELKAANLKEGEEEELEGLRSRMKHSVQLAEKSHNASALIEGNSGSALESIVQASRLVKDCLHFDPSIAPIAESLDRALAELSDAALGISKYSNSIDASPEVLEEAEDRLHLIRRTTKKFGGSISSCLEKMKEIELEISRIENYDDELSTSREELETLRGSRTQAAKKLSAERKKASAVLGKKVEIELAGLGMQKAKFGVSMVQLEENNWNESGSDEVKFVIAPNVGEPSMPLAKIASGGELSRVMLALKACMNEKTLLACTSVFDEVDSGIGGKVASIVGEKLKGVANSRQVICVTHLPQVAAFADSHLNVSKVERSGRTITCVSKLSTKERVQEIARMLGSNKITQATFAHAEEMIGEASGNRKGKNGA